MAYASPHLQSIISSLRSVENAHGLEGSQSRLTPWPFVTISRQAGTGAFRVGALLAERLNANGSDARDPHHPWQCLDRELVEHIAADQHLSADLIRSLEHSTHTWIAEFLHGLSIAERGTPSELFVFRRAVETMRGLARAGHVVLVGLGGVYITNKMRGAVHARLIAPFEWRVKNLERIEGIRHAAARAKVRLLDRERQAFFAKFWPDQPLSSDMFHITLNAAGLAEEQMADALAALLRPTGAQIHQGLGFPHKSL